MMKRKLKSYVAQARIRQPFPTKIRRSSEETRTPLPKPRSPFAALTDPEMSVITAAHLGITGQHESETFDTSAFHSRS